MIVVERRRERAFGVRHRARTLAAQRSTRDRAHDKLRTALATD
jgi:hypothetical protein